MALAAGQGLKISSPYGGFVSDDEGLETTGPILRVQVKCTMCRYPKGDYSLNIRGPKYRGYPKGTVDFFALYITPPMTGSSSPTPCSEKDMPPCTSLLPGNAKNTASISKPGISS